MKIGSLFSGIGGLELGLKRAGLGPVIWQAESDPFCRRVLAKHWPEVKRYDDVRDIDETVRQVDLLCGGFPCQDISDAGLRRGIEGERSGLWSEFARIIRLVRPRFVVVENVAALLLRGMGRVVGDLAASGYLVEWDCIPAASVGASHLRAREFLLAYTSGERLQKGIEGTVFAGRALPSQRYWALPEPGVAGASHGIPNRLDRVRALGNAVVPQAAEVIGRAIVEAARSGTVAS